MTDRYTKGVLTIIAAALVVIAFQQGTRPASAGVGSDCGGTLSPCYVANIIPLSVTVR